MAKIITIPENKKIKALNEGFFDDVDEPVFNDTDNETEVNNIAGDLFAKIDKDKYEPLIKQWLDDLCIEHYSIEFNANGQIYVDVDEHLILSNRRLTKIPYFHFREVKGDCNFANNKFTDWTQFPTIINGDLIANFNYIRDFKNAPIVAGKVYAERQRIRTLYKLNQENYKKAQRGEIILENVVYIPKTNKYGVLTKINENVCSVLHDDKTTGVYSTNEVEVLNGLDYLKEWKLK